MAFFLIIGVLLVAVSVALLVRALALTRIRTSAQLRQIDTYGYNATVAAPSAQVDASRPSLKAHLNQLAEQVGRATQGSGWRTPVDARSLRAAGVYSLNPEAFHGYRVMGSVALPAVILLPALGSGSPGSVRCSSRERSPGLGRPCWCAAAHNGG